MSRKQKYVLIGMGAFGREIARTLLHHNADVIVMDKDDAVVNRMKQDGFEFAVQIDTTDAQALGKFIKPDDVVILAMGESFEDNILTVGILKELRVKKIFARATSEIQMKILDKMDITETLFPEKQEGKRFAMRLLFEDFKFVDEFTPDVFIGEIAVPAQFYDKTIIELNIRNRFNVNVIGLKQKIFDKHGTENHQMFPMGFENTKLTKTHSLVVVGLEENIQSLVDFSGD